jgi:hypothetical protein
VSSLEDVGLFNSLFFDDRDEPAICSYSAGDRSVYLFHRSE